MLLEGANIIHHNAKIGNFIAYFVEMCFDA